MLTSIIFHWIHLVKSEKKTANQLFLSHQKFCIEDTYIFFLNKHYKIHLSNSIISLTLSSFINFLLNIFSVVYFLSCTYPLLPSFLEKKSKVYLFLFNKQLAKKSVYRQDSVGDTHTLGEIIVHSAQKTLIKVCKF